MAAARLDVAVITPSLDQARYLPAALESVRSQPGVRVEHLVVDGGSTDATLSLLRRWEDVPFARWVSESDRGQAEAVNKGLSRTTAPIVGWLNADDEYVPGALAAVVQYFDRHPRIDVVFGDCEEIDMEGRPVRYLRARPFGVKDLLDQRYELYQPSFFFRRAAFDRVGPLDERLHLVLDFELILRVAERCSVGYVARPLARHRRHREAKSARAAHRFMPEFLQVLDAFFERSPDWASVPGLRREAYRAAYLEGGARALAAGDAREARRRLFSALGRSRWPDRRTIRTLALLVDAVTGLPVGRALVRMLRSGGDGDNVSRGPGVDGRAA